MAYTVAGSNVITDSSDGILNTIQLSPTTRPPVTTRKLYDSDGTLLYNGALIGTTPVAPNWQYFTSPGTYTASAGVTGIRVEVVGGGGGYRAQKVGTPDTPGYPAVAGGGGGAAVLYMTADSATSGPFTVTIGATGASLPSSSPSLPSALNGGTSSFGTKVSATGGSVSSPGVGTGVGGDINTNGVVMNPSADPVPGQEQHLSGASTISNLYGAGGAPGELPGAIVVVEEYF